jgi:hypothetical protein
MTLSRHILVASTVLAFAAPTGSPALAAIPGDGGYTGGAQTIYEPIHRPATVGFGANGIMCRPSKAQSGPKTPHKRKRPIAKTCRVVLPMIRPTVPPAPTQEAPHGDGSDVDPQGADVEDGFDSWTPL